VVWCTGGSCAAHGCAASTGAVEHTPGTAPLLRDSPVHCMSSTQVLSPECVTSVVCIPSVQHPPTLFFTCAVQEVLCTAGLCHLWVFYMFRGVCFVSQVWHAHGACTSDWCLVKGLCGARRRFPGCHRGSPSAAALEPALTDGIPLPPARLGRCQGRLQLSGDEAPCWGASQSGCCATGACLQPHWRVFKAGRVLCVPPPLAPQPFSVRAEALSREAVV